MTKLTPTQIAVQAAEAARSSAAAAASIADSLVATSTEQAEFRGYMRAHLESQAEINKQFSDVATNHMPHIQQDLGEVRGQVKWMVWAMGIIIVLIAASGILVPLVS